MCLTNSFCLPTSYSKSVSYFIVNYSGRSVRLYEMLIFFFLCFFKRLLFERFCSDTRRLLSLQKYWLFFFNFNHRLKIHSISYIYLCFLVYFVMVLINHHCYEAPLFTIIIIIITCILIRQSKDVIIFCKVSRFRFWAWSELWSSFDKFS